MLLRANKGPGYQTGADVYDGEEECQDLINRVKPL